MSDVATPSDIVIAGPGMKPGGDRYVLSTVERGRIFVQALNEAYDAGFAAGLRQSTDC